MAQQPQPQDNEVQKYLNNIAAYEREFSKWETRVTKILKRYRDDTRNSQDTGSRFNILWSNVQTLKAATFAKLPKPDVSRRFKDNDQVGRVASLLLERALEYEINHYTDYRECLTSTIYDRFIGGRGTAWVRYVPKFTTAEQEGMPEDGTQITDDAESEGQEEQGLEILDYECAPTDYVHWKDFGHNVARTWEEVSMVWRKVYMSKEALEERFGEDIAKIVPMDASPEETKNASKEGVAKQALIYELWDKDTGKAIWLSKSISKIIDERDDPLKLEEFWPCPKPLYATITNESLVPIPDFALYQDQANALDTLSDRIDGLVKALQVKGVYDAATPELARLFTEANNNDLIPIKNYAAFAEKGGLKGGIDMVDIKPIAEALVQAYNAFEQVKSQIYDITGISDIIRGQSVASETATAQQIKGQYASMRLKVYQDDVARFAGSMIKMKAQIICQHFSDQTLLMISGADQLEPEDQQLVPQALQLLRNEPMRTFRIEVASDSMVNSDEQQEKQDRMEFLNAVGAFIDKAVPASEQSPDMAPLLLDLLSFGVRGFRVGKTVEGAIENASNQLRKKLANPPPPQPTPEQEKLQMEQAQFQQNQQQEAQRHAAEMQQTAQLEQMKAMIQAQADERENQREHNRQVMEMMNDMRKALLDAQVKLEVAEISAKTQLNAAQVSAAQGATQ